MLKTSRNRLEYACDFSITVGRKLTSLVTAWCHFPRDCDWFVGAAGWSRFGHKLIRLRGYRARCAAYTSNMACDTDFKIHLKDLIHSSLQSSRNNLIISAKFMMRTRNMKS